MTVEEIAWTASARRDQTRELAQLLAWVVYNGASLIGVAVNDPRKFPRIEEAFPSLFEKQEQQDWRVMKQRIEAWRETKNNQF